MLYLKKIVAAHFAFLAFVLFAGFAFASAGQPMLLPVDPVILKVDTRSGERQFSLEVANDETERSRGLMYRRDMPDDRGMLFVFQDTRRVAFWMKNTPMPLDLLFIDEQGIVRAIMQGQPFSEASISPPVSSRFVLELKSGTAQKAGIAPGDRLIHPEIDRIAGRN